jgi:hypothetical protein
MRTKAYTARPTQRRARDAWDYFIARYPIKIRTRQLAYSPNISGDGPGWVLTIGNLPEDTLHWHGGDSIIHTALAGNIRHWAESRE